jgi:hypothetical protein
MAENTKEIEKLKLSIKRLKADLHFEAPDKYPDNCQVCHGDNGGVKGNENIIDGIVMCDYCHMENSDKKMVIKGLTQKEVKGMNRKEIMKYYELRKKWF